MSTVVEEIGMSKEATILNVVCVLFAIGLLVFAVANAVFSGDFLTTDNLFLTTVCLVLALMFAASPLASLLSSGKLPLPFLRRTADASAAVYSRSGQVSPARAPALLDAKGRAVPPDVQAMVDKMKQPRSESG